MDREFARWRGHPFGASTARVRRAASLNPNQHPDLIHGTSGARADLMEWRAVILLASGGMWNVLPGGRVVNASSILKENRLCLKLSLCLLPAC